MRGKFRSKFGKNFYLRWVEFFAQLFSHEIVSFFPFYLIALKGFFPQQIIKPELRERSGEKLVSNFFPRTNVSLPFGEERERESESVCGCVCKSICTCVQYERASIDVSMNLNMRRRKLFVVVNKCVQKNDKRGRKSAKERKSVRVRVQEKKSERKSSCYSVYPRGREREQKRERKKEKKLTDNTRLCARLSPTLRGKEKKKLESL